jgi:hypothetical protein
VLTCFPNGHERAWGDFEAQGTVGVEDKDGHTSGLEVVGKLVELGAALTWIQLMRIGYVVGLTRDPLRRWRWRSWAQVSWNRHARR